jgi:hypothetical protein
MISGVVVGAVLLLAVLVGAAVPPHYDVASAAPLAGPTPVSVTRPANAGYAVYELFGNDMLTADTTAGCVDVGAFGVLDAQYQIDQTAVNTVTLTTQWSIDGALLTDGVDVVTSNAADAGDLVQVQPFGRYLCAKADVANTNPVTVTLFVIAK